MTKQKQVQSSDVSPNDTSKSAPSHAQATEAERAIDTLVESMRPLSDRDPERWNRIQQLAAAKLAVEACADEGLCWETSKATSSMLLGKRRTPATQARVWVERWMKAAEALRTIAGFDQQVIINIPNPGRPQPGAKILERIACIRPLFIELLVKGNSAMGSTTATLGKLLAGDPDSFPAQAWYFSAVAFELQIILNDLSLSEEERKLKDALVRSVEAMHLDVAASAPANPNEFCSGDRKYPRSEWMLVRDAVAATGLSDSTVKRRCKKMPAGDVGETEPKPRRVVRIAAMRALAAREKRNWKWPPGVNGDRYE